MLQWSGVLGASWIDWVWQTSHIKETLQKCNNIILWNFSQCSEWDQILVGVNKVLMFLEFVDHDKRMKLGFLLEHDINDNGLNENWDEENANNMTSGKCLPS